MVPGGGTQPEMFLVLEHVRAGDDDASYGSYLFSKGLTITPFGNLSRRLSDGRVYFWDTNTKTVSYRFWSHLTNTAALTRDESHENLTGLENDLQEGLARHDEWWRAKAATDPKGRLTLLRPFLLCGGGRIISALTRSGRARGPPSSRQRKRGPRPGRSFRNC